jgi:hypothetical protein
MSDFIAEAGKNVPQMPRQLPSAEANFEGCYVPYLFNLFCLPQKLLLYYHSWSAQLAGIK